MSQNTPDSDSQKPETIPLQKIPEKEVPPPAEVTVNSQSQQKKRIRISVWSLWTPIADL